MTKERWTLNYGKMPECLSEDTLVDVAFRCGESDDTEVAGDWYWDLKVDCEDNWDIIAWRRA